eukprot:325495-Pelagomonas_calceolata.AAC.1
MHCRAEKGARCTVVCSCSRHHHGATAIPKKDAGACRYKNVYNMCKHALFAYNSATAIPKKGARAC